MAYGRKKSIKEKFNAAGKAVGNGLRKLFMATLAIGAIGGAGYYEYGTVQEQNVRVLSYQDNTTTTWDDSYSNSKTTGHYTFVTDKGTFIAEPSMFHLQSQDDARRVWNGINGSDNTYHIKTYGYHIAGSFQPNILEARQVSEDELKRIAAEREKMAKQLAANANKKQTQATPAVQQQQQQTTAAPQQAATGAAVLSGQVHTIDVMSDDGTRVRMTVPKEVSKDDILIQSIVTPRRAAPQPPAGPSS